MKIIVDADACPVKDIVMEEAARVSISVTLVSSLSHYSGKDLPAHVKAVYVEAGPDAADFKIVQLAGKDDIVITQDYGLASLLLPKGCIVLHHKGFEYNDMNIDNLLATRHMGSMIRKGGGRTRGPKPFTNEDKAAFLDLLQQKLEMKQAE